MGTGGVAIPRLARLRGRGRFSQIYQQGVSWSNPYLVMKALPNGGGLNRFAFVAGKATGGAVVRNRLRRRLREAVRLIPIRQGWDILCIARPPARQAKPTSLREAATDLLRRARLLPEG